MKKYILPIVLAIALIATGVWGYYQYNERNDYHTYLDIQFQRQFYDLIGYVENVQVDMAKAMVTGSNSDMIKYLNDISFNSYLAQEKLTQLPLDHGAIRRTETFLNQLGDYSTAMVSKSLDGILLDEKEMNTLVELQGYANTLSQELIKLQQHIVKGGVNFGDLRREGNRDLSKLSDRMQEFQLINFEERMQEYPTLIYDGPFSEHLKDINPKLEGKEVTDSEAIAIVQDTFNNQGIRDMEVLEKIDNTPIPGYYLRSIRNNNNNHEISAAVSEKGGNIIWYFNTRNIAKSTIKREEAIDIAQSFLKDIGYENMVPTYTMNYEGQSVINFAYKEGDVIIYSDLIKVKVALDNGEIIGLETEGFLTNHHNRNIKKPELTETDAKERLSSGIKIEHMRLAIIPTAAKKEVLCYEFKGKLGQDNYLIYIDADTGKEIQILLMVQQEDGTLVM